MKSVACATVAFLLVVRGADAQAQAVHSWGPDNAETQQEPAPSPQTHPAPPAPDAPVPPQKPQARFEHPLHVHHHAPFYGAPGMERPAAAGVHASAVEVQETPAVKPGLYGIKTFFLGLVVVLALLLWTTFFTDDGESLQATFEDEDSSLQDKVEAVTKHVLLPFPTLSEWGYLTYTASWVFLISGITEMFLSVRRRLKAKKGQAVSVNPPLRGGAMMHIGLLTAIAALVGAFAGLHNAFYDVGHVAEGLVIGASLLFMLSAIQRFMHWRRSRKENKQ